MRKRKKKPKRRSISEAASMLGTLGALKGAMARTAKLSAERRSEIARMGAAARWAGHRKRQPENEPEKNACAP